jgi:hypothetical protein
MVLWRVLIEALVCVVGIEAVGVFIEHCSGVPFV